MAPDPEIKDPPVNDEGLTTEELEGIVGKVVDAKIEPLMTKLDGLNLPDMETFKGSILQEVGNLITANKSTPVDEEGLLSKVGSMLDEKMKGVSNTPAVKRIGPLSRWLAG